MKIMNNETYNQRYYGRYNQQITIKVNFQTNVQNL